MKKIFISLFLFASIGLFSQELDQAYLDSLPESVRDDVLQNMNNREELEKPIYRRPSSMVSKNYCDDDDDNNSFDLDKGRDDCVVKSNRFGNNFFDTMQSSFMPINEPNFDSSYILDFGDTLELQLVGQKNSIEVLPVKRDGSINIPQIGKVFVSGLSLDNVNIMIRNKVSNAYIGIEAFVSLVDIRDIQVLITGNAFNPGIYTLNGNSNSLHAISMAGGIDEGGSYRQIELIRNDKLIKTIDLYDVFIHGKSGFGLRLRSGDSIIVKPAKNLINISGAVKRPGLYELLPDETFKDLFDYSNGFSKTADVNAIRIERLEKEKVSFIPVKDVESLSKIKPIAEDSLNIRSYERKKVTILGAVKTPGTYVISKGETLSSLIDKAEGYRDDAYPFGGILNNEKALKINKEAVDKLYTSFIQKLITKGDALFASESLPFILDELKRSSVTGRVSAEFDLDVIKAYPETDTNLDNGDEIIIPIRTQQVYIFGEVNNSGAIRYKSGSSLNEYLLNSGGVLESADTSYIFVAHPNGEVNRIQNVKLSFLNKKSNNILIYPGSIIYVPRKVNSRDSALVASIWAPIISAMATSITALSVLDKN
jgi:polysaccharide biosynthesis/export protein